MKYSIYLRNYRAPFSIGIYDFEKAQPQELVINVIVHLEYNECSDDIENVLDYDFLIIAIREMAASGHINLQETLCKNILDLCLSKPNVLGAEVTTEKTNIYKDADAIGCKMVKFKD